MKNNKEYMVIYIYPQRRFEVAQYYNKTKRIKFINMDLEEINKIEMYSIPTEHIFAEELWAHVEKYTLEEFKRNILK